MAIQAYTERYRASVTSTTATPVTIHSYTVPASTTITYAVTVRAVNTTDGNLVRSWTLVGSFKLNSGTLTQLGTTTAVSDHADASPVSLQPTFGISGANLLIQTAQGNTKNITWDACIKIDGYTYA